MPRTRRFCLLLAIVVLLQALAACSDAPEPAPLANRPTRTPRPAAPAQNTPPTRTPAANQEGVSDWTVLVYLDGDNDLEAEALDDFSEMATVGSNDRVQILVQLDRVRSDEDWDDTSHNNWGGVKRFRVTKGAKPTKAYQLADIGERNAGDPKTLVDFATWGIEQYPAQRYALIFWDHGAAWPGIASDDTSDGDMLTLPELSTAFAQIGKNTGVRSFDLIGFDACLMGQIDVLQAVAPYGKVAIGSADLEPGEGWAWNRWLEALKRDPNQDAATIAPAIIKSFMAFYNKEGETSVTLSAFDLEQVGALTGRLDTLAQAMLDNLPRSYSIIGAARSAAAEYASGDKDISAVDLGSFARALREAGAKGTLASAAAQVEQAIEAARIYHDSGSDHPEGTGVSLYFPQTAKRYDKSYVQESPLTGQTRWDEFLQAFYRAGKSRRPSDVNNLTLSATTAAADNPVTLQATVAGEDTASVAFFVGQWAPESPDTLRLLMLDYLYPSPPTAADPAPAWPAEPTDASFSWASEAWYLSNGRASVLVPFEPSDYGSQIYTVEGTYRSKTSGNELPVTLEFELAGDEAQLLHIWAFESGENDEVLPRELEPRRGDQFVPSFYTVTVDANDELVEGEAAGEALVLSSAALVARKGPAPSGEYVVGLWVENHAGEISDQYADVVVGNPE